jgi:hypothetical protein
MRLRFTVLATVLAALASAAVPAAAGAAPQHNRGLTIHAVPHNIIAGEAVLIYGQLQGADHSNQVIHLYHRINPGPVFTLIGTTRTNANGQYEFVRAEGIVESNRSWFVRGPFFTHSRTVHERVAALVSLAASSASGVTRNPIIFSGHVTPNHVGETVLLQSEVTTGTGNQFKTLKRVRIGPGSNFQAPLSFRVPGAYSIRAYFPGDGRNTSAPSDLVAVVIQQAQTPDFTIQTSDPIVTNGSMYTISGTLYAAGTTTPEPNTNVSLFARRPQGGPFREITTTTTASDGTYSFPNQESTTNELYQVRTTFPPARHTATLFEGVQDVVTISSSSSTSTVGGHITFSGDVSPDKAGHVIYLQRLGKDGNWHTVEVRFVNASSTFQFGWTFGTAGVKQFRAQIDGGPANVGGASGPVTVDVTQPALNQLPTL